MRATLAALAALVGGSAAAGLLERRAAALQPPSPLDEGEPTPEPPAPGGGLACVKWRKTLNCEPSGPRDPLSDKDCSVTIPGTESGFCECEGYVHTAAVPCNHRPVQCEMECHKVVKLVREVFGANYTHKAKDKGGSTEFAAGQDPYTRARVYGDKAVTSVNEAVTAANAGLAAAKDMIARMMSLKPWTEIAKAGKKAEEAGMKAQDLSKVARPFIYGQVNATHHLAESKAARHA